MKETIILAPGAGASELLRTMARFGVSTLGLRIVSHVELAKMALMKSGKSIGESFLTSAEEPSLIFSYLNSIPYFSSASYADAEALAMALGIARRLIPADEANEMARILSGGEFPEKNQALLAVYQNYMQSCSGSGLIDGIALVRRAVADAAAFDADFRILKEYPLQPLDEALLKHVSGGTFTQTDLAELMGRDHSPVCISSFSASYGAINEAEGIISHIFRNGLHLDKCIVACANTTEYGQIFYDLSKRYDIPMTFGSGIPINNSNPAALLKLLYEWNTSGYNGKDALRKLLTSPAINRKMLEEQIDAALWGDSLKDLVETAGSLRLSFKAEDNKNRIAAMRTLPLDDKKAAQLDIAEALSHELELGYADFIEKYSYIRAGISEKIDQSGLSVVCRTLRAFESFAMDSPIEDIIPEILNKTVSSETSKEGMLHVCSVPAAMAALRENLFVCGLSAADFPGSPSENFLLLDSDLELFGAAAAPTSAKRIENKKQTLQNLIEEASALGSEIRLSFPDFDLADIKDQNPSSVLFDIYGQINPGSDMEAFNNALEHYGYFDSQLSAADGVGKAVAQGKAVEPAPESQDMPDSKEKLNKEWSPTALEVFFQCPRHFYLHYICGIEEPEEDDPFTVINAKDQGSLVHKLMEQGANKNISKDEFLELSDKAFDDFLKSRPPIHSSAAAKLKKEFQQMMADTFEKDPKNKVLSAEDKYIFEHPSGIKIKGYPDRVEQTKDGQYIIADFKTKRKVEHVPEDIDTCLQVVLYAWLCSQAGIDISRAEYRYLRKSMSINCTINDAIYNQLNLKLLQFKDAMERGDFPRNPGKQNANCKYCTFGDICEWDVIEQEAENDE